MKATFGLSSVCAAGGAHLDTVLEWRAALVVAQASCLCVSVLMHPRELTGKMPVPLHCRRKPAPFQPKVKNNVKMRPSGKIRCKKVCLRAGRNGESRTFYHNMNAPRIIKWLSLLLAVGLNTGGLWPPPGRARRSNFFPAPGRMTACCGIFTAPPECTAACGRTLPCRPAGSCRALASIITERVSAPATTRMT